MAKVGRKLQQMCEERYDNDDVISHVIESATNNGTVAKIESGELVLPHPADAQRSMEENKRRREQEKA